MRTGRHGVPEEGPKIDSGNVMHAWLRDLFPVNRSLMGPGVRETLQYLVHLVPSIERHSIETGTEVNDWVVPYEWRIRDAFIADKKGRRLINFQENNLHVVGYSTRIDAIVERSELDGHLHSLPDLPNAIPYVTSYYNPTWGFCLTENQRSSLPDGPLRVVIDSDFVHGTLDYGDLVIPGESKNEVMLTSYICHPSMANNELSGPVVLAALARWLLSLPQRRYTYRLVWAPETLGAIAYLASHLDHLRRNVVAGWVLTCIGDEGDYSHVASRRGNTLSDRIAAAVLRSEFEPHRFYSYLDRGSDERQWCYPNVDLPMSSIMRTKYGEFKQYHTSLDDTTFVTPAGLAGGFELARRCIEVLELNIPWRANTVGEPQMGRRDLYPTLSTTATAGDSRPLMNVLAYCDGQHDVLDITEMTGLPLESVLSALRTLRSVEVIGL